MIQQTATNRSQDTEMLQLFPVKDKSLSGEEHAHAYAHGGKNVDHGKHRTIGNKIYDWGVYTTFAWAGVAGLSLLSAHEALHGKNPHFNWLRSINDGVSGGLSKALSNTIMKGKPKETIEGWAKGSTMFVTLGMGGWAMMAPIKWLEDNREKNAAKIDNFLGTNPPNKQLIAEEIPQTWGSVMQGRLLSWAMSYAAFAAMGPKTTSKVSNWAGDKFTKVFMALKPKANEVNVRRWADIGAFDATFTVITAAATYAFSRIIAKKQHRRLDSEDVLMTIDPATPTPQKPLFGDYDEKITTQKQSFTEKHDLAPNDTGFLDKYQKNKELSEKTPQLG